MFNGQVIRDARRAQHLTQSELAAGISNQETISHIENNLITPRDHTIRAIIDRLHLSYEAVIPNKDTNGSYALAAIDALIRDQHYRQAAKRLSALQPDTLTVHTELQANFLKAFAQLQLSTDYDQAIFEFNRTLSGAGGQLIDLFAILSLEQLGFCYYAKNQLSNAQFYFHQIPKLLDSVNLDANMYWITFVYNDLASFYAATQNYKLSNQYAKHGLKLLKEHHQSQFIDTLSLTLGSNYERTRPWETSLAKHYLTQARTFAKFNGHTDLATQAEKILARHE